MTLPSKGTRTVRVGAATYRWRIRRRPTYSQDMGWSPLRLGIQLDGPGPHGVLAVNCKITRPDNIIHPHQTGVTPALVRQMIEAALAAGWQPASGASHQLSYPLIMDAIG